MWADSFWSKKRCIFRLFCLYFINVHDHGLNSSDYSFLFQLKKKQSSRSAIPDVSVLDFKSDAKTPDGKPWNKKFASWNINGIRAWLEVVQS